MDVRQKTLLSDTVNAMLIFSYAYITRWISFVIQSFMLAIEKPLYTAIISIATAFIFPVVLLFALEDFGLNGIWFNFAGTNVLSAILAIVIFLRERKEIFEKDCDEIAA